MTARNSLIRCLLPTMAMIRTGMTRHPPRRLPCLPVPQARPPQQLLAVQPRHTCIRSKRKRYCVQRQPPGSTQLGLLPRMPPGCAQAWARTV
jgi:hypothetical protein